MKQAIKILPPVHDSRPVEDVEEYEQDGEEDKESEVESK